MLNQLDETLKMNIQLWSFVRIEHSCFQKMHNFKHKCVVELDSANDTWVLRDENKQWVAHFFGWGAYKLPLFSVIFILKF